jgi:putative inorganic carbon (HCO3(-)) transporter
MGFALFIVYLVFTFVRPGELIPALADWPLMETLSLLALLGAGLGLLAGRGPSLRAPQIPLFLVFGWAVLSVVASGDTSGAGLARLLSFTKSTGVAFVLVVLNVDSLRRVRIVAATLAMLGLFEAGQGVLAYHWGVGRDRFLVGTAMNEDVPSDREALGWDRSGPPAEGMVVRIRGLGYLADPNDLANVLVAFLPLIAAFRRSYSPWRNAALVWLPIAATLYCVYLTRSRGGILALAAVVALSFRARLGRVATASLAAAALVALLWLGFAGGRAMTVDRSAEGRIDAWSDGLQMLKASPVYGVGFGTFGIHHGRAAHSSFVECFAELGLVGYFIWLALLAFTLNDMRSLGRWSDEDEEAWEDEESREISAWGRTLTVSIAGFLVGAVFLSHAYDPMLFLILGLALAVQDVARGLGHLPPAPHLLVRVLGILVLEGASILGLWGYMRFVR